MASRNQPASQPFKLVSQPIMRKISAAGSMICCIQWVCFHAQKSVQLFLLSVAGVTCSHGEQVVVDCLVSPAQFLTCHSMFVSYFLEYSIMLHDLSICVCAACMCVYLHCALAAAVYCNRSCLWVGLWVCYHDNSKLRASILTKLGL